MTFWTPERVDTLRAQWAAEIAVALICASLETTKGTVIGKARRLGLPMHPGSMSHPDRVNKPYVRQRAPRKFVVKLVRETEQKKAIPAPDALNITFNELADHHCRFVTTNDHPMLFCGAEKQTGSSYCPYHHNVCHEMPHYRRAVDRGYQRAA